MASLRNLQVAFSSYDNMYDKCSEGSQVDVVFVYLARGRMVGEIGPVLESEPQTYFEW